MTAKKEDSELDKGCLMAMADQITQLINQNFSADESLIRRDLLSNFRKVMEDSPLHEDDRLLNLLAIATSLENSALQEFAVQELASRKVSAEFIREAKEMAAIMGMLNTYYKFKGSLTPEVLPDYPRSGLRVQSKTNPLNGKEKFEMMALSVSVVNACPLCITAHEKALRELGVAAEKIHDLARLAAICKGLTALQ
jgi:alkyl hydroperoxide reductase subunit D